MSDLKENIDYSSELLPLQNAIEKIDDKDKKTIAEAKLTKLKSEIAVWKTRACAIEEINKLKSEYIWASKEKIELSPNIKLLKDKIEKQSKEPLTALSLSNILKELPKDDLIGRAYVVQYVIWKVRKDWYDIILNKKWVSLSTNDENIKKNWVALETTFNNHIENETINKKDIEQALIISSGSLTEFSQTFWDNVPDNIDNKDYVKYLIKKHSLSPCFSKEEIKSNNNLSQNEKSLLISYTCWGISNSDINPVIKNYEEMKKQAKIVFESNTFKILDKTLSWDNTTKDAADLAKTVTEDPSVLAGKPMTTIAAVIAWVFALWYQWKGKWFSLWSWLKRWFMWIIALFVGWAVAKEWWMNPKALLKEWMDLMKKWWEKAKDAAKWATESSEIPKNPIFEKYKLLLINQNNKKLNKEKILSTFDELSKNQNFLKSPASLLKIFETEKNEENLKDTLKTLGIDMSEWTREYYKYIFTEVYNERTTNVWECTEDEKLWFYLEKKEKPVAIPSGSAKNSWKWISTWIVLSSNQRLDKNWNLLTWEFLKNNDWTEVLINWERRNKEKNKVETFKDGKLIFTYEWVWNEKGQFNWIVRYNNWTWKVDIFENWEIKDYTIEYMGWLIWLLWLTLAPSLAWPGWVVVSWIAWVGYSIADLYNQDEDLLRDMLKTCHVVDKRFEWGKKTLWDNAFAAIWLVPWIKQVLVVAKISKYVSKLSPDKMQKIMGIAWKVTEKIAEKTKWAIKIWENTKNWILSSKKIEKLVKRRDFLNKEASQIWKTRKEIEKLNKEINEIESAIRNSQNWLNWAKESAKIFQSHKSDKLTKVSSFFDRRYVSKTVNWFKEWQKLEVWWDIFIMTKDWKLAWSIDWKKVEFTKKQFLNHINTLSPKEKEQFLFWLKEAKILAEKIWKIRNISWHQVQITEWWVWHIVDKKTWTILEWEALEKFLHTNIGELSKKFFMMSIVEWWVKMKEWIVSGYEKFWVKTVWDYLEKAWYKEGDKSKLFWQWSKPIDALGWIVLTPLTTIRQLIDAIPNKEWENIFRILISWNKNTKVWWWVENSKWVFDFFGKLFLESWAARAWAIWWVITKADSMIWDKNNWAVDEIWDYAFYRYGWIVNTLIMKTWFN